jgi:spore germination protein GerM
LTAGLTVVAAVLGWVLFVGLPRWYRAPAPPGTAAATRPAVETPVRRIKARLFYVGENGATLTGVERDVAFAEGAVAQAKEIINAQLGPAEEPLVSAVPAGTMLRALFITAKGEAYVDFNSELTHAHPGGSLNEMLTVYAIVDALTVNLPAVSSVQLLIDGKEVETLAGHVDLRQPLTQNLTWVQ